MGSQGYNSLPSYYVKSSDPVTPNYGFSLKGMDPILAENWVLADAAIGSGGSTVEINGVTVSDPNFNNTTPAAPMGDVNVTWQVDVSGNVSAYVSLSGGTVTSVAMTGDGTIFNATVTGSPITTSGTLIPVLLTQTANMFLAGPATGSAASPTFRALTVADLPSGYNLWNNNGNANGQLTLANGNFTTTFNQTSGVAWTWANTTVGTSSSVNSSPILQLEANYYSGSLSEPDTWSIGTSLGVGVNGSSLLGILHSGTSGLSGVLIGNSQFTTSVENSPYLVLGGSYEVSASLNTFAEDNWYFQNVVGSGAEGSSTLQISHAGTTGAIAILLSSACTLQWAVSSGLPSHPPAPLHSTSSQCRLPLPGLQAPASWDIYPQTAVSSFKVGTLRRIPILSTNEPRHGLQPCIFSDNPTEWDKAVRHKRKHVRDGLSGLVHRLLKGIFPTN